MLYLQPASMFGELAQLVLDSTLFAKIVLLVLLSLSVISWAVMIQRGRLFARAERSNRRFWEAFEQGRNDQARMRELAEWSSSHRESPLAGLFHWFVHEFWPLYREQRAAPPAGSHLGSILQRGAERISARELERLEEGVPWLATFSAVAPFIGLMGTVWGIMNSFLQIGQQGTATLDAVGPGIAEALITTVCGLAVAIPAVVGYNLFVRKLRRQEHALHDLRSFLADLISEEAMRSQPGAARLETEESLS